MIKLIIAIVKSGLLIGAAIVFGTIIGLLV